MLLKPGDKVEIFSHGAADGFGYFQAWGVDCGAPCALVMDEDGRTWSHDTSDIKPVILEKDKQEDAYQIIEDHSSYTSSQDAKKEAE